MYFTNEDLKENSFMKRAIFNFFSCQQKSGILLTIGIGVDNMIF